MKNKLHKYPIDALSCIADVSSGFAFKSKWFEQTGEKIIRIGDIGDEQISQKNCVCINSVKYKIPNACITQKGDILMALSGATTGKIGIVSNKDVGLYVNQRIAIIRGKKQENKKFLKYVFSGKNLKNLLISAGGAAQANLSPKSLREMEIPLPPLEEQKRIAAILDKADTIRRKRQAAIKLADNFLRATFLHMFGDPVTNPKGFTVRKLSDFYLNAKEGTKCGPFGSALKKHEFVNSGVPVWNMDNIDPSGLAIFPFRMWITNEKFDELRSYSVHDGDIIISRAGTVGKMCIAQTNNRPSVISTNLIRLRLGNELLPLFFVLLMTYYKGRVGRLKTGRDGAFTHMNTGILDNLHFPYPPLNIQRKFAKVAKAVEMHLDKLNVFSEVEDNLFHSLTQRAFRGEL